MSGLTRVTDVPTTDREAARACRPSNLAGRVGLDRDPPAVPFQDRKLKHTFTTRREQGLRCTGSRRDLIEGGSAFPNHLCEVTRPRRDPRDALREKGKSNSPPGARSVQAGEARCVGNRYSGRERSGPWPWTEPFLAHQPDSLDLKSYLLVDRPDPRVL